MSGQSGSLVRMPSRAHETWRNVLRTIAEVAGYQLRLTLPDGTRPDVLRVHVH